MSLVRDLWQGKLRLWITYWICGLGGNMSFVALLSLVDLARGARGRTLARLCLLAALVRADLRRHWRAAGRYGGPAICALLARLDRMASGAALVSL